MRSRSKCSVGARLSCVRFVTRIRLRNGPDDSASTEVGVLGEFSILFAICAAATIELRR